MAVTDDGSAGGSSTGDVLKTASSGVGLLGQIIGLFSGNDAPQTVGMGGGGNSKRALAPTQLQLLASVPNIQSLFRLLTEQENAKRTSVMNGMPVMGQNVG